MRSIRTSSAALAATFESLGSLLSSHRGATRVSLAALSFTVVIAFSHQAPTQAGPEAAPITPEPLLPHSIGIGVATDASVTIPFDSPMDRASVEAELQVLPVQHVELAWNEDRTALEISADRLWRADERYLIVLGDEALDRDGNPSRTTRRFAFSTELAPSVSDFQVRLANADLLVDTDADPRLEMETSIAPPGTVSPDATAIGVSATSSITVSFSDRMDTADVEDNFVITPQVEGETSWWHGNLIFTPSERLEAGARYTISVIGAHDVAGNELGGKGNFSFHVRPGAQLTKTLPERDAGDAEPTTVELWFSQPMEVDATNEAFALTDTTNGALVGGNLSWNDAGTQLTYVPDDAFAGGRTFEVAIGGGARDTDGNAFTTSWSFTTKAQAMAAAVPRATTSTRDPPPPAPVVPPAAPATSLAGYALNQVNAARAAYGFAPVVLDASVSAVAASHAMDQAANGYFSHTGANGSTRESRLRAGGVSFGWSGENQCYHVGMSQQATLDWCHAQFMAEPYPGYWNHIANILNPNAHRMGVGIATVGGRTVIVWDFVD